MLGLRVCCAPKTPDRDLKIIARIDELDIWMLNQGVPGCRVNGMHNGWSGLGTNHIGGAHADNLAFAPHPPTPKGPLSNLAGAHRCVSEVGLQLRQGLAEGGGIDGRDRRVDPFGCNINCAAQSV